MSVFDSKEFKQLRDKFYKKLKKTGFNDIENTDGNFRDHKTVHTFSQRVGFKSDLFEAHRNYFIWAYHQACNAPFSSKTDRTIWLMHSEGKSCREIAKHVPLRYRAIAYRIKQLRLILIQASYE